MTTAAFDTWKFAKTLQAAHVPPDQAEGIAQAFAEATGNQLATKSDLKELELSIRSDLKGLEGRFNKLEAKVDGRFCCFNGCQDSISRRP